MFSKRKNFLEYADINILCTFPCEIW